MVRKRTEEDTIMKTVAVRRPIPRYPNAADHRYYLRKLVDGALSVAVGLGATVAFLYLYLFLG
jgi:hypothetical protein